MTAIKGARVVLLVLCGFLSALTSLLGLGIGLWGGLGSPRSLEFWFWFLPALSFPAYGLYFAAKRMILVLSWLFFLSSWFCLATAIWLRCVAAQCTTTNPLAVAGNTLFAGPIPELLAEAICLSLAWTLELRSRATETASLIAE